MTTHLPESYKEKLDKKIKEMTNKGRKEISTKEELNEYPPGTLISYITITDVFHVGGFLKDKRINNFTFIDKKMGDDAIKVLYSNVKKMYVGSVYECKNDLLKIEKSTKKSTEYPVKVGDIVVYYASDHFDQKRFMNTNKFKNMIKWYETFKINELEELKEKGDRNRI
jgi:hypothetical protein